ncbi:unnamed protein product [Rotaria sp. Silwood1]|nr:unnamed protein product [Rotaria sp. Silwood1]CAF3474042.1 unnamed protein product [Rotaria sp. Silwood1]CAF3477895.1 unnamed protein product [Rotaria sp. Silwood1]CAF4646341.1 unnamed protein product [Rotaria sp. Silwood1]CAF4788172.1 unnamed protein product [Rotaria sp. Silwood1]
MALALLSTPDQLKSDKKGSDFVLNQLLQLVMNAAKNARRRSNGFHISESLAVMAKMFVVEERTLDYILCNAETEPSSDTISTIRLFITLLIEFRNALKGTGRLEQFTLIALLNILWSISFQPNYAQELINHQELIVIIRNYTEDNNEEEILGQYKPRSMEGIKEAAHGILHNLKLDIKNELKLDDYYRVLDSIVSDPLSVSNCKPLIMISYSHANNTFCSQILDLLGKSCDAFEIWIDRTHCHMSTDLWESIAEGMENACIILCLISNQYFESKSCRKEFIYAVDSLKKIIVSVLLENFEPRGWLGIRMTGMKYIRIRNLVRPDEAKMTDILNTILSSLPSSTSLIHEKISLADHSKPLSQHHSISTSIASSTKSTIALRSFEQWTSAGNDINDWFASNRISTQIRDLFDFQAKEEMLEYAQLLMKDREHQMNIYAKIYHQK